MSNSAYQTLEAAVEAKKRPNRMVAKYSSAVRFYLQGGRVASTTAAGSW